MTRESQDQRWDRERDYRKCPTEVDAFTIAILARASTTSFDEAVSIIQQFANTVASEAAVKATEHTGRELLKAFDEVANA